MLVEEPVVLGILQHARPEWKSKVHICLYRCPTLDVVLSYTKSTLHCRRLREVVSAFPVSHLLYSTNVIAPLTDLYVTYPARNNVSWRQQNVKPFWVVTQHMFRDSLWVPSSRFKQSKKNAGNKCKIGYIEGVVSGACLSGKVSDPIRLKNCEKRIWFWRGTGVAPEKLKEAQ